MKLLRLLIHWAAMVYTVLIIGTVFVSHDEDHTRMDHLTPIILGVIVVYLSREKDLK